MQVDQEMIALYARWHALEKKLVKIKAEIDNIREQIKQKDLS